MKKISVVVLLSCMVFVLAGCIAGKPSKYYVLSSQDSVAPTSAAHQHSSAKRDLGVGVGPVHVPGYLDRNGIVTRKTNNQLYVAERHVWAESFENNVARVLHQNLDSMLEPQTVILHPWGSEDRPKYQVSVVIQQFERTEGGDVMLEADLTLRNVRTDESLTSIRRTITTPCSSINYDATVSCMSGSLHALSKQISELITEKANT